MSSLCNLDSNPLSAGSFLFVFKQSCCGHWVAYQQNSLPSFFLTAPEFCSGIHFTFLQDKFLRGCCLSLSSGKGNLIGVSVIPSPWPVIGSRMGVWPKSRQWNTRRVCWELWGMFSFVLRKRHGKSLSLSLWVVIKKHITSNTTGDNYTTRRKKPKQNSIIRMLVVCMGKRRETKRNWMLAHSSELCWLIHSGSALSLNFLLWDILLLFTLLWIVF